MGDEKNQKQEKNEKHNTELEELKQKAEDFENRYKRALADYHNLEKRVKEERAQWLQSANKDLLLRLLPGIDMLFLTAKHTSDKGVTLGIQQILDILKAEGITRIVTEEKMFDPHSMECIQARDGEEGKILEEVRAGYLLHEKVLRPAQVVVGQKSS